MRPETRGDNRDRAARVCDIESNLRDETRGVDLRAELERAKSEYNRQLGRIDHSLVEQEQRGTSPHAFNHVRVLWQIRLRFWSILRNMEFAAMVILLHDETHRS